eukprot:TRINITY_DN6725_c0_g1_i3.p1 TRINITY_DN6725_c0_g1~~TRINITY_DN6725_c0_g1_i3.p1  ORF type:complete len:432 (+),score=90.14 TRINITY_DN6725_c0_g1_i3:80-1375(+)
MDDRQTIFGEDQQTLAFTEALSRIAGSKFVAKRKDASFALALKSKGFTTSSDALVRQFDNLAQEDHLRRQTQMAVDNDQLEKMWKLLEEHSTLIVGEDGPGITFAKFTACGKAAEAQLSSAFRFYFQPYVFYGLHRHPPDNAVAINQLFNLIMQGAANERYRLSFIQYDENRTGVLNEDQFEAWLNDRLPTLPHLKDMTTSFYPTYLVYAAAKFFFLLDKSRTRQIKLVDLLSSPVFAEFMELQQDELPHEQATTNWFSIPYVTDVHTQYVELDRDKDGLLSYSELCDMDGGSISPAFVKRLLQEYRTFGGKADYRLFLELVLARTLPNTEQSIRFYFRVLDVDGKGYLTTTSLLYFWRQMEAHPQMQDDALEPNFFENVKNEIFDMVRPKDQYRITLDDLLASKQGGVVSQILTDVQGFSRYENRESVPM